MPFSEITTSISDKQLAANRANAARSTGPRSLEGKSRSAQNARKHGFTASAYAIVRLENLAAVANLRADLVAAYQPVNSQELLAIERIAIAQNCLLRAAALETGLFTTCMNMALGGSPEPIDLLTPELVGDLEVTRIQNRNVCLAAGFLQMTRRDDHTWQLFLRYQAQAERHYRRAVDDFDRIKSLRPEIPNEPISDPDPIEDTPLPSPETNPILGTAGNLVAGGPTPIATQSPQPTDPAPTPTPIGFVPPNAAREARPLPPAPGPQSPAPAPAPRLTTLPPHPYDESSGYRSDAVLPERLRPNGSVSCLQ
jgi:hypothetical protein